MAELSEVQQAIATFISAKLYPDGVGAGSVTGTPHRIYSGWPMSAKLDKDLQAGTVNVSVFGARQDRNTTRYPRELRTLIRTPSLLTGTVSGTTITLGGTPTPGAAIVVVNGKDTFAVAIQAGMTLANVASALATLIDAHPTWTASSTGANLTVPGARKLELRRMAPGALARELRREERQFTITVWAPTPTARSATSKVIDPALAKIDWLTLPDGSNGRIRYVSTMDFDEPQKALEYRRDIIYSVEYPTLEIVTGYEVICTTIEIDATQNDLDDPVTVVGTG